MFLALEEIKDGEFTGFLLEAEDKKDILNQLIQTEKSGNSRSWYVKEEINGCVVSKYRFIKSTLKEID